MEKGGGLCPEAPHFGDPVSDHIADHDCWPQAPEAAPEGHTDSIVNESWGGGLQTGQRKACRTGLWPCKVYLLVLVTQLWVLSTVMAASLSPSLGYSLVGAGTGTSSTGVAATC